MYRPFTKIFKLLLATGLIASQLATSQQGKGNVAHPSPSGQSARMGQRPIEITEQDFTKAETLRSTNLRVFGIHLGQPEKEAVVKVASANLVWKVNKSGNVEVQNSTGKALLTLGITDGEVELIGLQSDISEYLKGDAKKLFSPTILAPQSSFRMAMLGREDERKEGENTVVYTYFKEGIEIQGITNLRPPAVIVALFFPAKSRS